MPRFSLKTLLIVAAVVPVLAYLLVQAPLLTSTLLIVLMVTGCLAIVLPRVTVKERCQILFVVVAFFLCWVQLYQLRFDIGPTGSFIQLHPLYPKEVTVSDSYGGWHVEISW